MFVAGCHRSGTSYLSCLLSEIVGCERSSDLDLTVDNPRGYFESTLLRPFNDSVLSIAGYSWDRPPLNPVHWMQGCYLKPVIEKKQEFSEYALRSDWVDKDPRLSLTFPLFQHLLLKRVPCLVPIRSPIDVAMSLQLRDGFSLEKGLFIWFLYNRGCSIFLEEGLDQLISYEALLQGDGLQIGSLVAFLESKTSKFQSGEDLHSRVLACHRTSSDHSLRRNHDRLADRNDFAPSESNLISSHCISIYSDLKAASFGVQAFNDLFKNVPGFMIDSYDRVFSEGEPSLEFLRNHDVMSRSSQKVALSAELSTGQYERDQMIIESFSELLGSVHDLHRSIAEAKPAQIARTKAENIIFHEQLQSELDSIYGSFSWRITAPYRSVMDRLKRLLRGK